MGKVVKIAAAVVGVAALVIPGVGAAISGAIFGGLGAIGGTVGAFAAAAFTFSQVATTALMMYGLSSGLSLGAKAAGLGPKAPKASAASTDRLRASLDPRAFRKIWFGVTAGALDTRYQEFTGSDQEYLNSINVHASHQVESIDQIWFDEKLAWAADGGVNGSFVGYLEVQAREVGTVGSSFGIPGSLSWTAGNSRFIGCAYSWLRYKLTGNTKKAESPFSGSVTSRITVRGKGALMYDPRLDSTRGGSGSHRAEDQTTWEWVDEHVGRNPALQLLWYLLGWRIQNVDTSEWRLAVGLGLPPERIDIDSFIAAANLCDEPVTLAAGGTEPRYRSDGVFSEGDDPSLVFDNLLAAMNGVLRDAGGRLSLSILHNDLATPIVDLTEADVIGEFTWLQTPPIDQSFNVVRGRYVDPSDTGLYQMADYPEVYIASPDGIERAQQLDLPMVQSAGQAQRLAKQFLQRAQYPGTFSANFLASAWRCEVGSVITLTFPTLGFDEKLFRVVEHTIRFDGTCPMVLREEHASIYSWDSEESPPVTPALPVSYDPLNEPWVQAIGETDADVTDLLASLVDLTDNFGDLDTEFHARNDRIATTPVAPTMPGGGITNRFEWSQNDDGTVAIKSKIAFNVSDEAANDDFEVEVWSSTSNAAYTPGSDAKALVTSVPIRRRTFAIASAPGNLWYTISWRTTRDVDPDVWATWAAANPTLAATTSSGKIVSAWVKSTTSGENPWQPTSTPESSVNVLGAVDGLDATIISAGFDPSTGNIASGKVITDSIFDGAVSQTVRSLFAVTQNISYLTYPDYYAITDGTGIITEGGRVIIDAEAFAWVTYTASLASTGDLIGAEFIVTRCDFGCDLSTTLDDWMAAELSCQIILPSKTLIEMTHDGTVTTGTIYSQKNNMALKVKDDPDAGLHVYQIWARPNSGARGVVRTTGYQNFTLTELKK